MLRAITILAFYVLGVGMCIVFSYKAVMGELREFLHSTPGTILFLMCIVWFILALDEMLMKRGEPK
jgi:hypothetical protein